jgi:hypothetical protein
MTPDFKTESEKSADTLRQMLGYDLRDLREILIALRPAAQQGGGRGFVALGGPFDPDQPPAVLAMLPTDRTTYMGATLLTSKPGKGDPVAIAFLERSILLIGDPASVRAAIERRAGGPGHLSPLLTRAAELSAKYHLWCVALNPNSAVPQGVTAPPSAASMEAAFQSVEEVVAGAILAPGVQAFVDLAARTEADAGTLRNAIALGAAGALQKAPPQYAKDLASFFQVNAQGKNVRLAFEIPQEKMMELYKEAMKQAVEHQRRAQPAPKTDVVIEGGQAPDAKPAPAGPDTGVVALPAP